MFQLWFFVAQKLHIVKNMLSEPARRVFQVKRMIFPVLTLQCKNHAEKTKVETLYFLVTGNLG